jgi:hypothetical protein
VEEEYTLIVLNVLPSKFSERSYMIVSRMIFRLFVLLVALFIATPFAHARPGNHDVREAVRDAQQSPKSGRESDRYNRFYEPRSSDNSSGSDSSKKAGRMSPEERRALRQQINEAGQDLYYRRR